MKQIQSKIMKKAAVAGATVLGTGIVTDQVLGTSWFGNEIALIAVGLITTASALATAIRDKNFPAIAKIINMVDDDHKNTEQKKEDIKK